MYTQTPATAMMAPPTAVAALTPAAIAVAVAAEMGSHMAHHFVLLVLGLSAVGLPV